LPASFQHLFLKQPTDKDRELLADFIISSYHEQNITGATKHIYIHSLVYLSKYLRHKKSFQDMTAHDVVEGYLNSLKRAIEADPEQRWIGTFNLRAMIISKFFKYLTQPQLPANEDKFAMCPYYQALEESKRKSRRMLNLQIYGRLMKTHSS
jgi:site-specific recombinase XerD